jgi:hypothetical protein
MVEDWEEKPNGCHVTGWPSKSRVHEYRIRAEEARVKAEAMENKERRDSMLQVANLWERMADYEEKNPRQSDPLPNAVVEPIHEKAMFELPRPRSARTRNARYHGLATAIPPQRCARSAATVSGLLDRAGAHNVHGSEETSRARRGRELLISGKPLPFFSRSSGRAA